MKKDNFFELRGVNKEYRTVQFSNRKLLPKIWCLEAKEGEKLCGSRSPFLEQNPDYGSYFCERGEGHIGSHVAFGSSVCCIWPKITIHKLGE